MSSASRSLTLYAVGDIRIMRKENPEWVLEHVAPILREADVTFAQLEGALAEHGWPQGGYANVMLAPPESVSALTFAGIDVVSVASNHTMDYGPEAMLSSIDLLRRHGIQPVGAGENLTAARQPVVFEKNGTRLAILAYVTVIPWGFEAGPRRPGPAPVRAATYYEQADWQPGTPPRIVTIPNVGDLQGMEEDIRSARRIADVVVVSHHWGIHNLPVELAMYEPVVGHAAVDAGADLVLGHHAHILKGIEIYRGKPIFYCIGDFSVATKYREGYEDYQHTVDRLYGRKADPNYAFHSPIASQHQKKTIIVKCRFEHHVLSSLRLVPAIIGPEGQPRLIDRECDPEDWQEWVDFLEYSCRGAGFDTQFDADRSEVVVKL